NRFHQVAALASVAFVLASVPWWALNAQTGAPLYNGKPLSEWFYGQRRSFLTQSAGNAADQVFKTLGTNAFSFLVSRLRDRGNSGLYFRFYRACPARVQALLKYPISGDDIRMVALSRLGRIPIIPERIPEDLLKRLGREVPRLSDPRVRMAGLNTLNALT